MRIPLVSIIVPVYNSAEYLEKCLDSLITQTLTDIEIICIDDCSSDDSLSILEKYAQKDDRVIAIKNTHNLKQGLTRSRGIDLAKGSYVAFVDSDDFVDHDMYQRMYDNAIAKSSDICSCFIKYHSLDGRDESIIPFKETSCELLLKYFLQRTLYCKTDRDDWNKYNPTSPCDKLFKRDFLNNNSIRFNDNRTVLVEDLTFNFQCFANNPTISVEYFFPYHYIRRENSTSTSCYQNYLPRVFTQYNTMKDIARTSSNNDVEKLTIANYIDSYMGYCLTETMLTNNIVKCAQKYRNPITRRSKAIASYFKELQSDDRVHLFFSKHSVDNIKTDIPLTRKIIYKTCIRLIK